VTHSIDTPGPLRKWAEGPGALFCLASLILCVDQLLGPYALVRFHDWFDIIVFGERNLGMEMLRHGGLLGWIPDMGGMPSFVGQQQPYALINMLMTLLPPWLVKSAMYFLVYWAAGAGMERLLRELCGLPSRVSIVGGFLFLASSIGVNVQIFGHYLPLFILCHLDLYRAPGLRRKAGPFLLILLMMLYSFPVISLIQYSLLHFLVLLAFLPGNALKRPKLSLLASTVPLWLCYALLYLPLFWALWDYLPEVNRVFSTPATPFTLQSLKTAVAILRSIASYTPTATLALCLAPEMLRDARVRRAGLILLLYLGVTTASMMPEVVTVIHGTFLEKIDFYHFLTPLSFCFVFYIALGLDSLRRRGALPSLLWAAIACGLTLPWLSTDRWLRNLLFFAAAMAALWTAAQARLPEFLRRRPGLLRGAATVGVCGAVMVFSSIMFVDVGHQVYARSFESVPELQALARSATEPFRVGGLDFAAPLAQSNGLTSVAGRKVLFNKRYKRYVLAATQAQRANAPDWMKVYVDAPTELYLRFPQDTYSTRRDIVYNRGEALSAEMLNLSMLEAINMTHLVAPSPVAGLEAASTEVRKVQGGGAPAWLPGWIRNTAPMRALDLPVWIYTLRDGFRRAYVAGAPVVLPDADAVAAALAQADIRTLGATVYLDKADLPAGTALPQTSGHGAEQAAGTVSRIKADGDALVCEGVATGPAMLVVSNNWDKNWRATVNGAEAKVLRCNLAFQAVALPQAGAFTVRLEYRNPMLWRMHWGSLAGLLGLMFLTLWLRLPPPALPPSAMPSSRLMAARTRLPAAPVLRGGLGFTALWTVLFFFLRCLKEPAASPRPVFYALCYTAVVGALLTFWWLRAEAMCRED
jgi:hypothetical protein